MKLSGHNASKNSNQKKTKEIKRNEKKRTKETKPNTHDRFPKVVSRNESKYRIYVPPLVGVLSHFLCERNVYQEALGENLGRPPSYIMG
jgi:hypothetical protein